MTTTFLRVHPGISTISQFLDYSAAADGMTYRNSAQPAGVTIDGVPDPALETGNTLGPELRWEQVSGGQGTATIVNRLVTNMPGVEIGSYYQDDLTPTTLQCMGYADTEAHGASGPAIMNAGGNSDPTLVESFGPASDFTSTRTTYFGGPGGDAELASSRSDQVDAPLQVELGKPIPRQVLGLSAVRTKRMGAGDEQVTISGRIRNKSASPIKTVKVCGKAERRLLEVGACRKVRDLGPGERDKARIHVELRRAGARTDRIELRLRAVVDDRRPSRARVVLKPRG